jgi:hypothetical protein
VENKLSFFQSDIEHLIHSQVWKTIAEDAMEKALLASVDLENLDPLKDATQMSRHQGLIEALKWIVDLPRIYAEELELYQPTSEEKEK